MPHAETKPKAKPLTQPPGPPARKRRFFFVSFGGKPRLRDLYFFTLQFAQCIQAGLPLVRALDVVAEGTRNRQLRQAALGILDDLAKGVPIDRAIRARPRVFSRLFATVFIGGLRAGNLPSALRQLSEHYEWMRLLRMNVLQIITYPLFLMLLGPLIMAARDIAIIGVQGGEVAVGRALEICWLYLSGPILGAIAAFVATRILKLRPVRPATDFVAMRVPIFGPLYLKYCLARFFNLFAMALDAGRSLTDGFRDAVASLDNAPLAWRMKAAERFIEAGSPIWESLEMTGTFSKAAIGTVRAAEEAGGSVGRLMRLISEQYVFEIRTFLPSLLKVAFPLVLIVVAYGFFGAIGALAWGAFALCFLLFMTF